MKQVTVTRICQIILGNGTLDICSIPMVPGCLKHVGDQSGTKNAKDLNLPTSTDNNVSISWFDSHSYQTNSGGCDSDPGHTPQTSLDTDCNCSYNCHQQATVHQVPPRYYQRNTVFILSQTVAGPGVRRQAAGRRLQSRSWCWRLDFSGQSRTNNQLLSLATDCLNFTSLT